MSPFAGTGCHFCAGQDFGISAAGLVLAIVTALAVLVMAGGIFRSLPRSFAGTATPHHTAPQL